MTVMAPCPRCDGGKGWSPHFACIRCDDVGQVPARSITATETRWKASLPHLRNEQAKALDEAVYGFSAVDAQGTRIDPAELTPVYEAEED